MKEKRKEARLVEFDDYHDLSDPLRTTGELKEYASISQCNATPPSLTHSKQSSLHTPQFPLRFVDTDIQYRPEVHAERWS